MFFKDVIGQAQAVRFLRESIDTGRVAHAQIISAGAGYGGLTLALAATSYIFCRERTEEGDSCGKCKECYKSHSLQHPDFLMIFPVGSDTASSSDKLVSLDFLPEFRELIQETGGYFTFEDYKAKIGLEKKQAIIRVAEAESLLRTMNLSSFQGGWRVIVIYLPEKMNAETANKLLKVIEEPPEKTLFFLVTEQYSAVLPTITSRCQLLRLPPLSEEDIVIALQQRKGVDVEKAKNIAHISRGSWCRAIHILDDNQSMEEFHEQFVSLMRLGWQGNYVDIFEWASGAALLGREFLGRFADYSIQMLRDSYMQSLGESSLNLSFGKDREFISKFAPFVNEKTVEPLVSEFSTMKRDILMNGNASIVLSHFALTVSKIFSLAKAK